MGRGPKGLARAAAMTAAIGAFLPAVAWAPTRKLLQKKVLPAPGEGPSEEAMRKGKFVIRLIGKGEDRDGKTVELRGEVVGYADPGYRGTAIMLGETALCLAMAGDPPVAGGVLTPASAIGMPLVERLRDAGMTWAVHA